MDKAGGEVYANCWNKLYCTELTKIKKEKINLKLNEWDWEERRWRTEVEEMETLKILEQRGEWGRKVYTQSMAGQSIMEETLTSGKYVSLFLISII